MTKSEIELHVHHYASSPVTKNPAWTVHQIDPRHFQLDAIGPFFCSHCQKIIRDTKNHLDCIDALDVLDADAASEKLPDLITYNYYRRDKDGYIDLYNCTQLRSEPPPTNSRGFRATCDDEIVDWLHQRGRQFCGTSFVNLRKLKPFTAAGIWQLNELLGRPQTAERQ